MILLDIIVLSELMKALPEAGVERWLLMHEEESHLPSIAIGELAFGVRRSAFGVAKLDAGLSKSKFEAQISEWRVRFAERTYAYDVPDAQIAAIAREHSCNGCDPQYKGLRSHRSDARESLALKERVPILVELHLAAPCCWHAFNPPVSQ